MDEEEEEDNNDENHKDPHHCYTNVFISERLSDLPVNTALTIFDFLLTLQSRKGKEQVLSSRETIGRGEASPQGRRGGIGMGSTPL